MSSTYRKWFYKRLLHPQKLINPIIVYLVSNNKNGNKSQGISKIKKKSIVISQKGPDSN